MARFENGFRRELIKVIGWAFPISNVLGIPFGVNLKFPELLLLILILYDIFNASYLKPDRPKIPAHILISICFCLLIIPFFSNIFSILDQAKLVEGANAMGLTSGGRYDPVFAPWIMLGWNVFTVLVVCSFSCFQRIDREIFFKALIQSLLITNIYAVYDTFIVSKGGGPDFPWPSDTRHEVQGQLRARGLFMEPLNFGHFLLLAGSIYFWKESQSYLSTLNAFTRKLGFSLILICFFLTFSTSSAVSLLVGGILAILFSNSKKKGSLLISASLVFGIVFVAIMYIPDARIAFYEKIMFTFADPKSVGDTLLERLYTIEMGWNIFKEYPIFGIGLGASGFFYPSLSPLEARPLYNTNPFPLNEYVRLLAETGVIGILGLLTFFALTTRYLIKVSAAGNNIAILLFWFATLIAFNFSGMFNVYYIWAFLGLCFSLATQTKSVEHHDQ